MTSTAITVDNVSKKYRLYSERNQYLKTALLRGRRSEHKEFWALKDLTFDVKDGETFGIIGGNGSGKSTLLKCLAGILVPDRGSITIPKRVAALLELGAGFHPELTGRENIFLNGAILGMSQRDLNSKLDDIAEFAGLGQFLDTPVKNYSSGMVVRLGFAIAINVDPEVLLIDEVLAVGDETFQQRCYERIEEFRRDGRTIVLVSHGLSQIQQLCSRVAWIDRSQLRELGEPYEVVSNYTGVSHDAEPRESGDTGDRWGTGEARIDKVLLLDSSGKPATRFGTGSKMTIRVNYTVLRPVSGLIVGVRLNHFHGMNIWGTNTKRRRYRASHEVGPASIDLTIDKLPFLEGQFDLTVALSDTSEIHSFDHWEKKLRFTVRQQGTFDEGLIYLESTWQSH